MSGYISTYPYLFFSVAGVIIALAMPSVSSFFCFPSFTRLQFFCECIIFSINGENKHYGTPNNPAAPACVPGGSCSGAAVAVAANLVDFSLGNLLFCCLYSKVCLLTFSRYSLDLDIQIFSWIHVALCTIS